MNCWLDFKKDKHELRPTRVLRRAADFLADYWTEEIHTNVPKRLIELKDEKTKLCFVAGDKLIFTKACEQTLGESNMEVCRAYAEQE